LKFESPFFDKKKKQQPRMELKFCCDPVAAMLQMRCGNSHDIKSHHNLGVAVVNLKPLVEQ